MNFFFVVGFLLSTSLTIIGHNLIWNDDASPKNILGKNNDNEKLNNSKWPFIVGLMMKQSGQVFCSGTILSSLSVLTAAHCLAGGEMDAPTPDQVQVKIVQANQKDKTTFDVLNWHFPKQFEQNKDKIEWDIVVIILKQPIVNQKVKESKVCLADKVIEPDPKGCLVMGWGRQSQTGPQLGAPLFEEMNVHLTSEGDCLKFYPTRNKKQLICVQKVKDKGTSDKTPCMGDSGGPLICPIKGDKKTYLQFGIVGFGFICGHEPTFFASVSQFTDWISETVKNGVK
ncbi:hypothetical protein BLOT_004313 [Blomia tropicalis]|nr:hypothetical protein BLOT_004313 [Blomia tropicalis]